MALSLLKAEVSWSIRHASSTYFLPLWTYSYPIVRCASRLCRGRVGYWFLSCLHVLTKRAARYWCDHFCKDMGLSRKIDATLLFDNQPAAPQYFLATFDAIGRATWRTSRPTRGNDKWAPTH
jgi:hypothetical protein